MLQLWSSSYFYLSKINYCLIWIKVLNSNSQVWRLSFSYLISEIAVDMQSNSILTYGKFSLVYKRKCGLLKFLTTTSLLHDANARVPVPVYDHFFKSQASIWYHFSKTLSTNIISKNLSYVHRMLHIVVRQGKKKKKK